jgi:hypothetical protein
MPLKKKRKVFLVQLGGTINTVSIASLVLRTAIRVIMGDGNFQQVRLRARNIGKFLIRIYSPQ